MKWHRSPGQGPGSRYRFQCQWLHQGPYQRRQMLLCAGLMWLRRRQGPCGIARSHINWPCQALPITLCGRGPEQLLQKWAGFKSDFTTGIKFSFHGLYLLVRVKSEPVFFQINGCVGFYCYRSGKKWLPCIDVEMASSSHKTRRSRHYQPCFAGRNFSSMINFLWQFTLRANSGEI